MAAQVCHLVCPDCHSPIAESKSAGSPQLVCANGHGPWPIQDGIPWFADETSEFDGRWAETYRVWKGASLFSAIAHRNSHWGIPHLFEPLLKRAGHYPLEMIDLGCGGGWESLRHFGRVTGVDISPTALKVASRVYDRIVGACVWRLPFPDGCCDVATSFWLVEHLREAEFVGLLREIRRVLRPDGHFIFLADLHSSKPILRWARSHPAEYRHFHVERVGHYGLRSLNYTSHLLRQAGYREEKTIPINKSSLLQPVTARWMFDNALGRKSRILRLYTLLCRLAQKSTIVHRIIYNLLMEYHRWADRHLPDSYAFSAVFDWKVKPFHEKAEISPMKGSVSLARPSEKETDPWSGLTLPTFNRGRRPVAVMVDNVPQAFPQHGLAQATTVFQAPVEGHCTRLLAIYTLDLPPKIGPVRSARPYFLAWAGAFQPFFIHCGASPEALMQLGDPDSLIGIELPYRIEEGTSIPFAVINAAVAQFDLSRNPPHFVFAVPAAIFEQPEDLSLSLPAVFRSAGGPCLDNLLQYRLETERKWHHSDPHQDASKFACQVEIRVQTAGHSGERFTWDGSAKGFRRAALHDKQVIAGSEDPDLLIRNLIVLETQVESIPGDLRGRLRIRACGEGPGYLWRDGPKMDLTWRKLHPDRSIQFFGERGENILLRPGLTWIHFVGPDGEVRIR
jgi:SAM-dependent methyltransferase